MRWVCSFDRALARFETLLLALLLIGMIALASAQVVLRNVWSTAIDWADPLLQHATLLVGLLGASVATSEGRHLSIDAVGRLLSGRGKAAVRLLLDAFGLTVAALLARGGWSAFISLYRPWVDNLPPGWSIWRTFGTELRDGMFPAWLVQLMLPAGCGLIALHFALRLLPELAAVISPPDQQRVIGEGERLDERRGE